MMFLKFPVLSAILLRVDLVWSSGPNLGLGFVGTSVDHSRRFGFERKNTRQGTELHPHRFNGGYSPASPLTWTPQQAAEFTIFHEGIPQDAGMQLRSTIQHWGGADLAEFLTRLYLGQVATDATNCAEVSKSTQKMVYEPQNVRSLQWEGLETREGVFALKDLLREALSKESLSAQEISRFAEEFLLKEYRWPTRVQKSNSTVTSTSSSKSQLGEIVFEHDSFYSLGHAKTIARVLLAVRKERGYDEFNSNDIASMVTLPERRDEDREVIPMKMIEFLRTVSSYTSLTAADKANIVSRMAISGWLSASIAKFMAELFPAETLSENHSVDEIWKLQGDAFFDFPTTATAAEKDSKKEKIDFSSIDIAVAKVAKAIGKNKSSLSSRRKDTAKDKNVQENEYEKLVQSYWKKVEVAPGLKNKQPVKKDPYGVPKTKSIKKRKIPNKFTIEHQKAFTKI